MIPVKVDQVFLSNLGFVVLLKGREDERSLPIFIGAAEAQSIAIELNGVKMPRPMTHDLVKNLLDYLECRLHKVEINDLKEGTFFAELVLDRDGLEMRMDSRPSDAIAVALRCDARIFVADSVFNEAGRVFSDEGDVVKEKAADGAAPVTKDTKRLTPREALQEALDRAVKDERYEDAAKLRDQIAELESQGTGN